MALTSITGGGGSGISQTTADGRYVKRTDGYESSTHAAATYATAASVVSLGTMKPILDGYETSTHASSTYATQASAISLSTIKPILDGYGAYGTDGYLVVDATHRNVRFDAKEPASQQFRIGFRVGYDGYGELPVFNGFIITKPVNQIVSSATLTQDNDFMVSLDAGCRYNVEFDGYAQSLSGNGFDFSWSGNVSVSSVRLTTLILNHQFGAYTTYLAQSLNLAKQGTSSGAGFGQTITTRGYIETGATGGSFFLSWCNDSGAAAQTLFKGSTLKILRC